MRDKAGKEVNPEWLAQKAVDLLEKAGEADEIDHAACRGYLDLIAKVLLPKVGGGDGRRGGGDPELEEIRAQVRQERAARKNGA